MKKRLICGVLLAGLVAPAFAQSTGPLVVEDRSSSRSSAGAPAVDADGLMLLMQQLQQYEQELAALRGQVEELRRDLETMRQAERERFLDLDTRINALASAAPAAASGGDPAGVSAGSVTAQPQAADQQAERDAYMAARDELLARRFPAAAKAFEQYLEKYPNGQFRDFSHFWLGEVYRSLEQPQRDKAMKHFRTVIDKYPQSSKASSALYKLAVLEYEAGDLTRAKVTLNKVIKQFPESSEAALARSMLDQLK